MQWYEYNDSRVQPVSQRSVNGGEAYVLPFSSLFSSPFLRAGRLATRSARFSCGSSRVVPVDADPSLLVAIRLCWSRSVFVGRDPSLLVAIRLRW